MQIAKQIAGFSPAEAETLRRAIGKKIHELMASLKPKFLAGCAEHGVTPAVADQLWKDMEQSQDYSFNKAHSACYALIAYRTAWLRANHPCEYMAALISSVMSTKDRVPFYVNACDEMGIDVLPPDVNTSMTDFAVVEGKIRFGLTAVKNVGEGAAEAIVRARTEGGPFAHDLGPGRARQPAAAQQARARVPVQLRCARLARTLAQGAAREPRLDPRLRADASRATVCWGRARSSISAARRPTRPWRGRTSTFPPDEYEKQELLRREKEFLGLYVSEHPLSGVRDQLRRKTDASLAELERRRDGEIVTVGGIVSEIKQVTTKRGEPMVFLALDDPDRVGGGRGLQLHLRGRARALHRRPDPRRQGPRRPQAAGRDEADRAGGLGVRGDRRAPRRALPDRRHARRAAGIIGELARAAQGLPGRMPCLSRPEDVDGPEDAGASARFRVQPTPDFLAEAKALLGEASVAVESSVTEVRPRPDPIYTNGSSRLDGHDNEQRADPQVPGSLSVGRPSGLTDPRTSRTAVRAPRTRSTRPPAARPAPRAPSSGSTGARPSGAGTRGARRRAAARRRSPTRSPSAGRRGSARSRRRSRRPTASPASSCPCGRRRMPLTRTQNSRPGCPFLR